MTAEDTRQLCLVSLPESLQTHLSWHTTKIADFGLKNLKRYICEKPSYFYLSRRAWSFKYCMIAEYCRSKLRKKNTVQMMNKNPLSPYLSALNTVCQCTFFYNHGSNRQRRWLYPKFTKTTGKRWKMLRKFLPDEVFVSERSQKRWRLYAWIGLARWKICWLDASQKKS